MNTDQIEGKWLQFRGELRRRWGKFTDDDLAQIEGDYQKFAGIAQERYGEEMDSILKWAADWHQRPEPQILSGRWRRR